MRQYSTNRKSKFGSTISNGHVKKFFVSEIVFLMNCISRFLPERWLKDAHPSIHPFANLPFSHGPRMCVGKRFAELEVQLFLIHMMKTFRLEWAGSPAPLKIRWKLIQCPAEPLKIVFHELS